MTDGDKPDVRPQDAPASLTGRQTASSNSDTNTDRGKKPHGAYDKFKNRPAGARARELKRIANAMGVNFFSGNALTLLQLIYKDPNQPGELRVKAAVVAMPYESPRLTAIEHSGAIGTLTHEEALKQLAAMPVTRKQDKPKAQDGTRH